MHTNTLPQSVSSWAAVFFVVFAVAGITSLNSTSALGQGAPAPDGPRKPQAVSTTRQSTVNVTAPQAEDGFHFVVYGDRTGGIPAGLEVLKQAVKDTNLIDPDLVMTVGDLIQGYNDTPEWIKQMQEYKSIMEKLNMSWYPVAGNHDIYFRGDGETPLGHHESNYEKHFGPLWYSFAHKNTGFIVLYSDEGDRKTNRKGFRGFEVQTMSDQQLEFLDKSLQEFKAMDHIMVFLHHPRWIGGGYSGGNWDVVHEKLIDAGNVDAVFAGHIHHMRYDAKDGIEYCTLATTGGRLHADIPDAGYLHHMNLVSVRKDRISVSAIPVGAVFDPKKFTPDFIAEIEKAETITLHQTSPKLPLSLDGMAAGEVVFEVTNPCQRSIQATVAFDSPGGGTNGWGATLDHSHLTLAAGETKSIRFKLKRFSGAGGLTSLPGVRFQPTYLGQTTAVRLPAVFVPVGMRLDKIPDDYSEASTSTPNHALQVTSVRSALKIKSDDLQLPDGPMTLEAWVKPSTDQGHRGIIAKTQGSEYALFFDEGVPQFDIHLNGNYVSAKGKQKLSTQKWTHLAGVFNGQQVMLFIDGQLASSLQGSGRRRKNSLPLFIGADPNRRGQATRNFEGLIDEVRLSRTAVYGGDFTPQQELISSDDTVLLMHLNRQIGPFVIDQSPSKAIGTLENGTLVPVQR